MATGNSLKSLNCFRFLKLKKFRRLSCQDYLCSNLGMSLSMDQEVLPPLGVRMSLASLSKQRKSKIALDSTEMVSITKPHQGVLLPCSAVQDHNFR